MKSKLVVKDNALIDASFNLTLVEQRLMLLAIVEARESDKLLPTTPIEITALAYSKQFKVDESTAYRSIAAASKTLKRREFSYFDRYKNHDAITVAGWVNRVTYVRSAGTVVLYLSDEVIMMISRLEEQFTRYHLEQVSSFDSKYSIRLYELMVKWKAASKTDRYEIGDLRSKLGVEPTEYKTMSLFKKNVLDKALNEINAKSDLTVEYEQYKTGKTITHISFKVKSNRVIKSIVAPAEMTFKMSDKQIGFFASKLANDDVFGSKHAKAGETVADFESRIADLLKNPLVCKAFKDDLIRVGYSENIKQKRVPMASWKVKNKFKFKIKKKSSMLLII